mmetsp:Transcript_8137/g.24066  ORF Transcript_8137/g.24066 Transcript_8137/m.24066 type:complete len:245 (+) Transcript_8137:40-774(+)
MHVQCAVITVRLIKGRKVLLSAQRLVTVHYSNLQLPKHRIYSNPNTSWLHFVSIGTKPTPQQTSQRLEFSFILAFEISRHRKDVDAVTGELSEQKRSISPGGQLTNFPKSFDAMSQGLGNQQRKRSYSSLSDAQDSDEAHVPQKRVNKIPDTSPKECLLNGLHSLLNEDIQMFGDYQTMDRLSQAQSDFKLRKIPCHVDVAYHHTRSENLKTIKTNGLLSRSERARYFPGVVAFENGTVYGDGI